MGVQGSTGRLNDLPTLPEFRKSWGAKENILYFKIVETNKLCVKVLCHVCRCCLEKSTNESLHVDSIPDVPIVNGFIYEQKVFNMLKAQRNIAVSNLEETKRVTFSDVCDVEMIEKLRLGIL